MEQATPNSETSVIQVYNPATEEQIGEINDGGAKAINEAVSRARESFDAGVWHTMKASERAKILWRAADLIEQRIDELAAIDASNMGSSPFMMRMLISSGVEVFRYFSGWSTKVYGKTIDLQKVGNIFGGASDMLGYTLMQPVGVVGAIAPWNGPIFNAINKLAPALTAGCSVVLKPAEETPLSAPLLAEILVEAGVPEGVVNVVNGYGHTAGAALAAHPDVDKIAFTGSTEVGRLIVQAATGNLKKVQLELGGKSPSLIFNDADLSKAIPGSVYAIFNPGAGQGCICGSRVFAQRGVYEQVVEGFVQAGKAIRLGGPADGQVDMGPLISRKQLDRVLGFIGEDRRDKDLEIVTGGKRLDRPGYFVEPTVLTNVRPEMRVFQEEIFGPVVTIMPFDDEDEAIALANNSIYGLAAAVWTQDLSRAHRLAKRLEAGEVWLNAQFAWDPAMPFGGHKQSGWGKEFGLEGLEAYMSAKAVYTGL